MQNKAIEINKITYDNKQNFEVHSIVKDEKNDDGIIVKQKHKVYIKVAEGEIENLSCTCDDYKENYCACEHIIATVKEFASNSDYVREKKVEVQIRLKNVEKTTRFSIN